MVNGEPILNWRIMEPVGEPYGVKQEEPELDSRIRSY